MKTHDVLSQQDAAEFAGWLRGQLFDQHQLGSLQAGWQKRLLHLVEDHGKVLAPILLSCSQKSSLQDLIDDWRLNDPFVCIFVQTNDMICIQVNRFPSLDSKFCEPIYGSRTEVLVPIFDAAQGFEVTWHSYRVTASVLHKGEVPTSGHYVSAMYTSLGVLLADDDNPPYQTRMHEMIASECYLLWLTPTTALQHPRWNMPICRTTTMAQTPALHDLLGDAFDRAR